MSPLQLLRGSLLTQLGNGRNKVHRLCKAPCGRFASSRTVRPTMLCDDAERPRTGLGEPVFASDPSVLVKFPVPSS